MGEFPTMGRRAPTAAVRPYRVDGVWLRDTLAPRRQRYTSPMPRRALAIVLVVLLVLGGGLLWGRQQQGPRAVAYLPVRQPITQTLLVTGRLASPARVQLGALVQSTVAEVAVEEGDVVDEGVLLVRLADDEAAARVRESEAQVAEAAARLRRIRGVGRRVAGERLEQARVNAEEADRQFARADELFVDGFLAEAEHDAARQRRDVARSQLVAAQLEAAATDPAGADTASAAASLARAQAALELAQAGLERTRLRAPSRGRVLERHVEVGQVVRPGDVLLQFAGEGDLEVRITPDEFHLGQLAIDQQAMVVTEAFPDRPLYARVSRMAPRVDATRGTVEVRLALTGEVDDLALRPDMTATVEVILGERDDALVLPTWLVRDLGSREPWVLVARDGAAVRVPVGLGLEGTETVEITSGLAEDDAVLAPDVAVEPGEPVRAREPRPAIRVED
ncbi:MAG: efflux RND transporter periplasmic adaptor subunit [Deltaproteobacteria bacterium]|nr:MAG: efflux RND transporter periplasmic adaptor subunit [Deltaproteobacteria bacterium]